MITKAISALLFLSLAGGLGSTAPSTTGAPGPNGGATGAATAATGQASGGTAPVRLQPEHLVNLEWRNIGPAIRSGRIPDIAVVEADTDIVYVATAAGGVFKSVNGGTSWDPVFDDEGSSAIGGIAVSQSNPNVVWVGTGESNFRNMVSKSWGDGVYKSEDGGKSWENMGLSDCQQMGRIAIHPDDPGTVYVTCLGSLWDIPEHNATRGVYKTTDGGETWNKVVSAGERGGFVDIAMDPRDPDLLYAAAWERERRDWSWFSSGPESGVFRTTDGGETWERLDNGLPTGNVGRVGVSVCRSQPDTVYTVTTGEGAGLYRSEDRGASWELRSAGSWYGLVRCDPNNPERVYLLSTPLHVSDDGGKTVYSDFLPGTVHVDHRSMWIDPADSSHMILGNDGGVYFTRDGGAHWHHVRNLPIMQFYEVGVDMREPFYYVWGGTQDDYSWGGPSATRNRDGIVNDDWHFTVGGDGFYSRVDPSDPNIVYAESQNGGVVRFNLQTGEQKRIKPVDPEEGEGYRWNWAAPILVSQHDPATVYFAAEVLFRSPNRGDTWEVISPDVSRGITYESPMNDYGTIRVIAESPIRAGVLAVGTDDGLVQVTRDGGATWQTTEGFPGVPELALVRRIVLSAHDPDTVYVASSNHEHGDYRPYLVRSTDFGRSWDSIVGNLPDDQHIRALTEHPDNPNLLFIGTEHGVWVSIDGGGHWVPLKNNLPTVPVHDMVVHPRENDLVIATHGRGFWILDDVSMLAELSDALDAEARLFSTRPALQFNPTNRGREWNGDNYYRAPNPPLGVILDYRVDPAVMDVADGEQAPAIRLEIFASDGVRLRSLELPQRTEGAGSHRVVWDMRYGPTWVAPEGRGGTVIGPWVLPGEYEARLTVGDTVSTQAVVIEPDPAISISDADRRFWHDSQVAVSQLLGTTRAALANAEMLDAVVGSAEQALEAHVGVEQGVAGEVERVRGEVDAVSEALSEIASRLGRAYSGMRGSTSAPTDDQIRASERGYERLGGQLEVLNRLVDEELPALHERLDAGGIPWSVGRPVILRPTTLPRPPRRR